MLRRYAALLALVLLLIAGCESFEDPTPASGGQPTRVRPTATTEEATATKKPLLPTEEPADESTREPTEDPLPTEPIGNLFEAGTIYFVDPDGTTVKSIQPDGSQEILFQLEKPSPDDMVAGLSADPTGVHLMYTLVNEATGFSHYLVQDGQLQQLPRFATIPHWSPDGTRLAADLYNDGEDPAGMAIFNVETGQLLRIPPPGIPTWSSNGEALIYAAYDDSGFSGIRRYEFSTEEDVSLGEFVDEWAVQQVQLMPNSGDEVVIFYGGKLADLGAGGNGMQWWALQPGSEEPTPLTDIGGNGVEDFEISPRRRWSAYIEHTSGGGCLSGENLIIRANGLGGGVAMSPPAPELQDGESLVDVQGLSWGEENIIAFAIQTFSCGDVDENGEIPEPQPLEQTLYIWDFASSNNNGLPLAIAKGSFPVWLGTP